MNIWSGDTLKFCCNTTTQNWCNTVTGCLDVIKAANGISLMICAISLIYWMNNKELDMIIKIAILNFLMALWSFRYLLYPPSAKDKRFKIIDGVDTIISILLIFWMIYVDSLQETFMRSHLLFILSVGWSLGLSIITPFLCLFTNEIFSPSHSRCIYEEYHKVTTFILTLAFNF